MKSGLLAMLGSVLLMGGNSLGIVFLIPGLIMLIKSDLASGEKDVILGYNRKQEQISK